MESKPEFEPIVKERLAQLHALWDKLESTAQEKARLLFDANRSELFDQSLADMKKWLGELQQQLQSGDEEVKDLTNANILLKKHQVRIVVGDDATALHLFVSRLCKSATDRFTFWFTFHSKNENYRLCDFFGLSVLAVQQKLKKKGLM